MFDVPYTDDDAKALPASTGLKQRTCAQKLGYKTIVRRRRMMRNISQWILRIAGDLQMCEWLFAHGAAEDVTKIGEEGGWHPM